MKKFSVFFLVLVGMFFLSGVVLAAQQVGDLKITGEVGVKVWLNNELKGEITSGQGFYLENLVEGSYAIRAEKSADEIILDDFGIVSGRLTELVLDFSAPTPLRVEDFVLRKKITAHRDGGDLVLRSIPLNARIFLDGREIGGSDKIIHNVPVAEHQVRFVLKERELAYSFTMHPDEKLSLKAHFDRNKISKRSSREKLDIGPEEVVLKTLKARKPALFLHRLHQETLECGKCHHLKDEQGIQVAYYEGMKILHCTSCHNPENMPNKKLSSMKLAGHALCKRCHRALREKGVEAPVAKCTDCHLK